jgi:hypothetical protein
LKNHPEALTGCQKPIGSNYPGCWLFCSLRNPHELIPKN